MSQGIYIRKELRLFIYLIITIIYYSCNPIIYSFTVDPLTTISKDSIKVNWKICGKPTLLIHEEVVDEEENLKPCDSISKYIELTLIVNKGKKQPKRRMIQVEIRPQISTTDIIFHTTLHGDTLIAAGEMNTELWGKRFQVLTITSYSGRKLNVLHENKTAEITGSPSNSFNGTLIGGYWEIRSLLTESEKNDIRTAPENFHLSAIIQYKK